MATPNTVYAREVAQLFVSGRHNQFRDATTRFGSLEGSRTLSSRALQAPTPSLPSSESIGEACLRAQRLEVVLQLVICFFKRYAVDTLNRCNTFSGGSQLQSRWLGHIFRMPNDRLPKNLLFGEATGLRHLVSLGLVSMMLRYVTVKTVVSIDLTGMLRTDCSGQTRLALHVPSSS